MPTSSETGAPIKSSRQSQIERYAALILAALALIYALLAGLHTLQDFDLGWQLATGRWIVRHRQIFSTDVFSYTAQGQPWIYPVFSGIIFYLFFLAGGYSLLCWMGALCCSGTIALLLRSGGISTAALALIAVPLIASRTQPRAEMFTTILFAAFLRLLWQHFRGGEARLWVLPALMVAWVNLHPGFIAGLALCATYVGMEAIFIFFPEARPAALARLRTAGKWIAFTFLATLANPWGLRIYYALWRQREAQNFHNAWLVEWEGIRASWASWHQALAWRDPQSGFWWLLCVAVICVCIALWRRQYAAVLWLACASFVALQHLRFEALFACVVVIVGGSVVEDFVRSVSAQDMVAKVSRRNTKAKTSTSFARVRVPVLVLCTALLAAATAVRAYDLVTNRFYLKSSQLALFGTGLSWWFPERALDFLQRENLPANVFAGYDLGGYLTWKLPQYPDYIDGRALPFGEDLFFHAYDLSVEAPDSTAWRSEAEARNINTIVVSLARYRGVNLFPQLQEFCRSQSWRPVYLDEVSAVFVRRTPQTEDLPDRLKLDRLKLDRLQVDCGKVEFAPLNEISRSFFLPADAGRFNLWSNAAGVLSAMGRDQEALTYLDRAQQIFSGSANLHLMRALALEHTGLAAEAEAEFRTSLKLEPTDEAWLDLGLFYMTQQRFAEAAEVFRRAAEISARPHDFWMLLGQADLQIGQAQPALDAFDKAEAANPFGAHGEALGAGFHSTVATGRAKAWYQLGDLAKAVSLQEEAVKLAPGDAKMWKGLGDLYDAEGRHAEAAQARARAGR